MAAESFANFATTTLTTGITPASTTLDVTTGQGVLFPSTGVFLATIESEIILCTPQSSNELAVLIRGYDNTVATAHASGAIVQLAVCAYNFRHLWQNVADTYTPTVPPVQTAAGVASDYDDEFESGFSNWTLYPTPASGTPPNVTTFNRGSALRSHLVFNRAAPSDSLTYYAWIAASDLDLSFAGVSFTIETCLSEGIAMLSTGASDQTLFHFFVGDQSSPVTGTDSSNRFKLVITNTHTSANGIFNTNNRQVQAVSDSSGVASNVGNALPLPMNSGRVYLRLTNNGSSFWQAQVGDGYTYRTIATSTQGFTANSLGFIFSVTSFSGQLVPHTVAIDYCRVYIGSGITGVLPPFGSSLGY